MAYRGPAGPRGHCGKGARKGTPVRDSSRGKSGTSDIFFGHPRVGGERFGAQRQLIAKAPEAPQAILGGAFNYS